MLKFAVCRLLGFLTVFAVSLSCAKAESKYIRQNVNNKSAIVFIHGLGGSGYNLDNNTTWTASNGAYWPELLSNDKYFDKYNIYIYEYPTSFLNAEFSIVDVSADLKLMMDADEVIRHQEIIFVAHSMGGIVARHYILDNPNVVRKVRAIALYSTPISGSQLATVCRLLSPFVKNAQICKMSKEEAENSLADLQRRWVISKFNVPSFCAYEKEKVAGAVRVVQFQDMSALCSDDIHPILANHLTIVKPDSQRHRSYLFFKSVLQRSASNIGLDGTKEERIRQRVLVTIFKKPNFSDYDVDKLKSAIDLRIFIVNPRVSLAVHACKLANALFLNSRHVLPIRVQQTLKALKEIGFYPETIQIERDLRAGSPVQVQIGHMRVQPDDGLLTPREIDALIALPPEKLWDGIYKDHGIDVLDEPVAQYKGAVDSGDCPPDTTTSKRADG